MKNRTWTALCLGVFLAMTSLALAGKIEELPIQSNYESSSTPLTTEKVWKLAPDELNPHRTRWLLTRDLQLLDLKAVPVQKPKHGSHVLYTVKVSGLYSHATSYTRGPKDPSYSPISQFPCTKTPVNEFATPEGTRIAADSAVQSWDELLSRDRIRLEVYLNHVRTDSPELAIHAANILLAAWQDRLIHEWNERAIPQARAKEWRYYWKLARAQGVCELGARAQPQRLRNWASLMEPVPQTGEPKLLARAPAKQWGGLFSVLVSLKIDKLELVGKFLIDSAAPQSVISPTFLENQGAPASLITVPLGVPTRISWSGGSGVATPAYIERAKIGDLVLPLHDFYIHDTDFFGPPESFANCCDGILGSDFLRQYAVQFRPGKGPEMNVYARDGFHPSSPQPWVEAHFNPGREIESGCTALPHSPRAKSEKNLELRGVRWDTGSEEALQFQFNAPASERDVSRWDLSCGSLSMARAMAIDPKDPELESSIYLPLDVGMALLGRGEFTFDLSHGRIWFDPRALSLPVVQNHSGLKVEFVFIDGDRYLKVESIRRGSAAEALKEAGLRPGMILLSINTKSVDDMDTWAVDQYLSGVYGNRIAVEWEVGHGKKKSSKFAVMKLPPASS